MSSQSIKFANWSLYDDCYVYNMSNRILLGLYKYFLFSFVTSARLCEGLSSVTSSPFFLTFTVSVILLLEMVYGHKSDW